jgi:hypothetical protein
MHFVLAVLAMLLFSGPPAFAGCGMDPDGCRGAAVAASTDQGGGIDPDGKPSR